MNAREVLNRYAAGERDFRRADLRGQSFQGQDLAGADFSEADIRGTNFNNANLQEANFTGANAGVQKRWIAGQLLLLLLLSTLAGVMQGFFGYYVALYFPQWWNPNYDWQFFPSDLTITVTYIITIVVAFMAIARQGFTARAASTVSIIVTLSVVVTSITIVGYAFTSELTITVRGVVADAGAGAVSVAFTVMLIGFFTFAGAVTETVANFFVFAGAVTGIVAGKDSLPGILVGAGAAAGISAFTIAVAVAVAVTSLGLGLYCSRRAFQGDAKFALLRSFGIAFAALGGTSFCGADLTAANFSQASLKGTNFKVSRTQPTRLDLVCWKDSHQLDRARVGDSILAAAAVRDLLVSHNGSHQSYLNANLSGAHLAGANLQQANLKGADLSGTNLAHADLRHANLTQTLALGTNFRHAHLTAACLEAWNIDHTTQLEDVDCQYVYFLETPNALGSRERRPHDPDQIFQPGDFETLYRQVINTIQVLLRNGMNRPAFAAAFHQLMQDYPGITDHSIQAIERKGNDALVTLEVPDDADKGQIAKSLLQSYETEVRHLQAQVQELHQLRAADLKDIALESVRHPLNIIQAVGENSVQETNDSSRKIEIGSIGGDFNASGQALNLGKLDISGTVTNAINQLPDESNSHQPSLKDLLSQLQAAIEAEPTLSDADKADLLEQVQHLAEAKRTTEPTQKEGLVRKAKKMFDATLKNLPDTAKIAEACSKLLPLILKALGFPVP